MALSLYHICSSFNGIRFGHKITFCFLSGQVKQPNRGLSAEAKTKKNENIPKWRFQKTALDAGLMRTEFA